METVSRVKVKVLVVANGSRGKFRSNLGFVVKLLSQLTMLPVTTNPVLGYPLVGDNS